jgi:hypothetical protein
MVFFWNKLPHTLQTEIFLWDSTFHDLFRKCIQEIKLKISKKLATIYLDRSIERSHGYFEFTYHYSVYNHLEQREFQHHHVTIHENTRGKKYRTYILCDHNKTTGTLVIQYIYIP